MGCIDVRAAVALGSLALAVAAMGCSANLMEGVYGCDDGNCPSGWFCHADLRCYSMAERDDGGTPPIDSGNADADGGMPMTDAGPTDSCMGAMNDTACVDEEGNWGICCSGTCVDPTSTSTCGSCSSDCGSMACVGGSCAACTADGNCNDGVGCTTDRCVSTACVHEPSVTGCTPPPPSAGGDCVDETAPTCSPTTDCVYGVRSDLTQCRDTGPASVCWMGTCAFLNSVCNRDGPDGGRPPCSATANPVLCRAAELCEL